MKKLKPKRQAHLERRRKKALARRQQKAAEQLVSNPPPTPKKLSAPRHMLRRQALRGTTYWRGDRFCLESYKGR